MGFRACASTPSLEYFFIYIVRFLFLEHGARGGGQSLSTLRPLSHLHVASRDPLQVIIGLGSKPGFPQSRLPGAGVLFYTLNKHKISLASPFFPTLLAFSVTQNWG